MSRDVHRSAPPDISSESNREFFFMQICFFCLLCTCIWNLKTIPVKRTLACKHKLWGKKSLYLRLYLKAFPVFNVLETIDLVIVKFIKKIIEQFFWIMRYCVDMDQITCKNVTKAAEYRLITLEQFPSIFVRRFQWNQTSMRWSCVSKSYHFLKILASCVDSMLFHCFHYQITCKKCNKSSWMQANNILLTRDRPEQFPSFFVRSFQWNQTSMRWSRISKSYHFLKILANCVDSMLFHCFHDSYNIVSKYFQDALIEFVQTLP